MLTEIAVTRFGATIKPEFAEAQAAWAAERVAAEAAAAEAKKTAKAAA